MTISHTDSTLVTGKETAGAVVAPLLDKILATEPGRAPLVARLALGAILFPHGAQHALGWFDGYGFSGTLAWMTGSLGFPAPLAALGIVTELLAPLALIAGAGGRLAAALLFFHMGFAASIHFKHGFFMNWFGSLATGEEGFEYHLLAMALAVVVAILGSGSFSIDRKLARARVTSGAS
ncbi:MAG TPA: DoxX family protein [Polyangiaceae bacterium]